MHLCLWVFIQMTSVDLQMTWDFYLMWWLNYFRYDQWSEKVKHFSTIKTLKFSCNSSYINVFFAWLNWIILCWVVWNYKCVAKAILTSTVLSPFFVYYLAVSFLSSILWIFSYFYLYFVITFFVVKASLNIFLHHYVHDTWRKMSWIFSVCNYCLFVCYFFYFCSLCFCFFFYIITNLLMR